MRKTTKTESETEKMVTIQLSPARNARHCSLWKVRGAPPPGLHRHLSQTCPVNKFPGHVLIQIPVKLNSYKKIKKVLAFLNVMHYNFNS